MLTGKRGRAKRWQRHMTVPTVPVNFHLGGHAYGGTTPYYDPQQNTVYWVGSLANEDDRYAYYHELGHAFDYQKMNDADRARIRRLIDPMGRNQSQWRWNERNPMHSHGSDAFEERFADTYAQLAMTNQGYGTLRRVLAEIAARNVAQP